MGKIQSLRGKSSLRDLFVSRGNPNKSKISPSLANGDSFKFPPPLRRGIKGVGKIQSLQERQPEAIQTLKQIAPISSFAKTNRRFSKAIQTNPNIFLHKLYIISTHFIDKVARNML